MNRVMSIRLNPYLVISDEASRFVEGGRLSGGSVLGVVAQRIMPASRNDNCRSQKCVQKCVQKRAKCQVWDTTLLIGRLLGGQCHRGGGAAHRDRETPPLRWPKMPVGASSSHFALLTPTLLFLGQWPGFNASGALCFVNCISSCGFRS